MMAGHPALTPMTSLAARAGRGPPRDGARQSVWEPTRGEAAHCRTETERTEVEMRLLKRHRDDDVARADRTERETTSDPGGDRPTVREGGAMYAQRTSDAPAGGPVTEPTEPVTEPAPAPPRRVGTGATAYSRRMAAAERPAEPPAESRAERRAARRAERKAEGRGSKWGLGPILSLLAGLALIAAGIAVLIRTGINSTWFRPVTNIFGADHTPLLGLIEIGAGVVLVGLALLGNRLLIAIAGIAGAILATAAAVEPEEVARELAIDRWWAWVLTGVGVALTLAALHKRGERRREVRATRERDVRYGRAVPA
jgi:hypothetical protein